MNVHRNGWTHEVDVDPLEKSRSGPSAQHCQVLRTDQVSMVWVWPEMGLLASLPLWLQTFSPILNLVPSGAWSLPARWHSSRHGLDVSFLRELAISLFPDYLYPPWIIINVIIRSKMWLINSSLERPLVLHIKILKVLLTLGWRGWEHFLDFLSGL